MKCLVTGATGYIGRQLCPQLQALGHTVVPLSKSGAPLDDGSESIAIDLAAADAPEECFEQVNVLIHMAGIAHQKATSADYDRLNCQATVRLARQAESAGVGCFVFLSSVKAMGPSDSNLSRGEDDCTPDRSAYGAAKYRAECALRDEFRESHMSVIILRPALVYGAAFKGNIQLLNTALAWHLPRPPDLGKRTMLAVDDLVALLCQLAESPPGGVHTWIVCGDESYSTRELYDALCHARGRSIGPSWLPLWAWRLAATLRDFLAKNSDESTFDKLFGNEMYSNAVIVTETGWRPTATLEQVLGDSNPQSQRAA